MDLFAFGIYVITKIIYVDINNINQAVSFFIKLKFYFYYFFFTIIYLFSQKVWKIQFHPTVPDYLLSAGDDGDLLLWDFHSPSSIHTQYGGKERLSVHRLLHSPL